MPIFVRLLKTSFVGAAAVVNRLQRTQMRLRMSGLLLLEQFLFCKGKRVRQVALGEDTALRYVMNDLCVFLRAITGR